MHITFEACGFGYEVAWWAREENMGVTVIAPSRMERPPGLQVKTDRLDVGRMARQLATGGTAAGGTTAAGGKLCRFADSGHEAVHRVYLSMNKRSSNRWVSPGRRNGWTELSTVSQRYGEFRQAR